MLSAGSETWESNDNNVPGFDKNGNSGTKKKNNSKYQYKHQYPQGLLALASVNQRPMLTFKRNSF